MQRFKGPDGRSWDVTINVHQARKVWDVLKLNLSDRQVQARMGTDERFLFVPQLLAVLCEDQLVRKDATLANYPDAQLNAMDALLEPAEVFDAAYIALAAEWSFFCRRRGQSASADALDQIGSLLAKARALDEAKPGWKVVEQVLDQELATIQPPETPPIPGDSLTSLPASLESSQQA